MSAGRDVIIVDYGMGNLGSVANMVRKLGHVPRVTGAPGDITKAERLILPGVGHFGRGVESLDRLGLRAPLDDRVLSGRASILGICLGMQLIGTSSEEGEARGLGWIDAVFVRFRPERAGGRLAIPLIGWNRLIEIRPSKLLTNLGESPRFYFVHSFHAECRRPEDVLAEAQHGYRFAAAFGRDNIMGVQFHPEKSHKFGMQLLKNFIEEY